MTRNHWYNVVFVKGTSRRSYMIAASCVGNARSIGWMRLKDIEGATQGWDLVQTSAVAPAFTKQRTHLDDCAGERCVTA